MRAVAKNEHIETDEPIQVRRELQIGFVRTHGFIRRKRPKYGFKRMGFNATVVVFETSREDESEIPPHLVGDVECVDEIDGPQYQRKPQIGFLRSHGFVHKSRRKFGFKRLGFNSPDVRIESTVQPKADNTSKLT